MTLAETYRIERSKWDALAAQKELASAGVVSDEDFHQYAARASTMEGVSEFLGDLRGRQVLEIGCGLGEISTLLARSGACVTAFDLSPASVAVAQKRASTSEVSAKVRLVAAAGEALPFAGESFDLIFGKAILHHLNADIARHDLYRVLKYGGRAAFVEPMGMNPFLRLARAYMPYPHKNPRGADRPLAYEDIELWGGQFREFYYREIQFLSMLERSLGFGRRLTLLRRLDRMLLRKLPALRRYCRYVALFMVK